MSTEERHHHLWGEGAAACERLCQGAPWVRCTDAHTLTLRWQCRTWKTHWSVCVSVLVLGESNSQMVSLTDELSQKNEELLRHQEEIAQLLSQIVELQHRVKEVNCCYRLGSLEVWTVWLGLESESRHYYDCGFLEKSNTTLTLTPVTHVTLFLHFSPLISYKINQDWRAGEQDEVESGTWLDRVLSLVVSIMWNPGY